MIQINAEARKITSASMGEWSRINPSRNLSAIPITGSINRSGRIALRKLWIRRLAGFGNMAVAMKVTSPTRKMATAQVASPPSCANVLAPGRLASCPRLSSTIPTTTTASNMRSTTIVANEPEMAT